MKKIIKFNNVILTSFLTCFKNKNYITSSSLFVENIASVIILFFIVFM